MTTTTLERLDGTVYLGRLFDRSHAYATIRLEPGTPGRTVHGTDHARRPEPARLSITGALLAPRAPVHGGTVHPDAIADGWVWGWGQTTDAPAEVLTTGTPALSRSNLAFLADTWERWHLNGMSAACEHMTAALEGLPLDYAARAHVVCPEGLPLEGATDRHGDPDPRPYRYGSAWLAEAVPAEVLERLAAILDAHRVTR
jgi:hypothetical protein